MRPSHPVPSPGGMGLMFEVYAEYRYIQRQPTTYDEGFAVGVPPWLDAEASDTELSADNFDADVA